MNEPAVIWLVLLAGIAGTMAAVYNGLRLLAWVGRLAWRTLGRSNPVEVPVKRTPVVQVVEREGFLTQYRFPAHERAECRNATCVDHYGPWPRTGVGSR